MAHVTRIDMSNTLSFLNSQRKKKKRKQMATWTNCLVIIIATSGQHQLFGLSN